MSGPVAIETVSTVLRRYLEQRDCRASYICSRTGEITDFLPALAADPAGVLPAFVVAADALWRDTMGRSFQPELAVDRFTVFGFRLQAIRNGPFTGVMLAMMEVIEQIIECQCINVNKLTTVWEQAEDRISRSSPLTLQS